MNITRFAVLAAIVLAAAASQAIPHPFNFSPIAAIALFGGAQFTDKRASFLVPLAAMFLCDLGTGLHILMPFVYGCFLLTVVLGFWIQRQRTVTRIATAAVIAGVAFFVITNFGVWALLGTFPKTCSGLLACYAAGLPYFPNTLLSNLFYSFVLFGGFALAERKFAGLRQPAGHSR